MVGRVKKSRVKLHVKIGTAALCYYLASDFLSGQERFFRALLKRFAMRHSPTSVHQPNNVHMYNISSGNGKHSGNPGIANAKLGIFQDSGLKSSMFWDLGIKSFWKHVFQNDFIKRKRKLVHNAYLCFKLFSLTKPGHAGETSQPRRFSINANVCTVQPRLPELRFYKHLYYPTSGPGHA